MSLKIDDYNYSLPSNLIANQPSPKRDGCRLLSLDKKTNTISHYLFKDLLDLLSPNDLLVLNQSKVFPARLFGKKDSGGEIEVLLIRQLKPHLWLAISTPRPKINRQIYFDLNLTGKIIKSDPVTGQIEIKFNQNDDLFFSLLNKIGHSPLPSYINYPQSESQLRSEYQTVYATKIGSSAAPTAGLHFTKKLLLGLKNKGVQIESLTLHVGRGTFQNLRPENIKTKTLHNEFYQINKTTAKRLNIAKLQGKRIIAVGTTTIRALESATNYKHQITPQANTTNLFIYPGFKFKFVDALITNFHLPKSSLLMLVSAFAGKQKISNCYQQAVNKKYRFFSFGDAMYIY